MASTSVSPSALVRTSTLELARRVSLPKTPPATDAARPPSANSSDDSPIEELSFDFTFDEDGNYIRISRESSKSDTSSPPTSQEQKSTPDPPPASVTNYLKPPSPILLNSPVRPGAGTLSRSENLYPSTNADRFPVSLSTSNLSSARSFQRVASQPLVTSTPSAASASNALRPSVSVGLVGPARKFDRPRRVTLEEFKEQEEQDRREMEDLRARVDEEMRLAVLEEKENVMSEEEGRDTRRHYSPPLISRSASSSSRSFPTRASATSSSRPLADQRGQSRRIAPVPNRSGRITKSKYTGTTPVGADNFDNASDIQTEGSENDYVDGYGHRHEYREETDRAGDDLYPPSSTLINSTARQRKFGTTALSQSGNTRPRRSASLSDASPQAERVSPSTNPSSSSYHRHQNRPGTSLGLNSQGSIQGPSSQGSGSGYGLSSQRAPPAPPHDSRRAWEEKRQVQRVSSLHDEHYASEYEEAERRIQAVADAQPQPYERRQAPSPTHLSNPLKSHLRYAHQRRDSDTLRSLASNQHQHQQSTSPSTTPPPMEPLPARLSPSARNFAAGSSSKNELSSSAAARHRRSPTAPEPGTTSGMLHTGNGGGLGKGKTWAGGDERDGGVDEYGFATGGGAVAKSLPAGQNRLHLSRQQQQQQQHYAPTPTPTPTPVPAPQLQAQQVPDGRTSRNNMIVNKKAYARLDVIGKGGSSRVYRVMNNANEIFAIKRVSLDKTDSETMSGYMNEIALLKRLDGNGRIIRLFDSELKPGPGGTKGHLLLVMEFGEIDLARLLQEQQKEPMNMVWISYYWQQMLQAVHVIHEEKIVHSDLKPANFVLVRGQLKLIDFGIANAIANDTTNIQRDHQIGTVNYMSPETIELPDGMRRLKVGRPSDVWSLGCILYQMVYGQPPFQHLSVYQKMKAIPDLAHVIDFPEQSTPSIPASRGSPGGSTPPKKLDHLSRPVRSDVIRGMKSCLSRNPKERCTIPELMEQDWLAMTGPKPHAAAHSPPAPKLKNLLAADETVINHHYMAQLIDYGVRLGMSRKTSMSEDDLRQESERLVAELKTLEQ